MADINEMKLSISIIQSSPPPPQSRRRSRSRKRGSERGPHHRSSPSPTSIIVDFDDFCDNLKGDGKSIDQSECTDGGVERRNSSSSSRSRGESGRTASRPPTGQNSVGGALFQMGRAEVKMGRWDEALKHFDRALLVQVDSLGREHEEVARTLIERGTTHAAMGSWYDSILDLERGLHIQRGAAATRGVEEGLEIAETLIRVGRVQHRRGNYVESVGSFRSALTILRRAPDQHGRVAVVSGIIAKSQHQRRRYGEAIKSYRDCLSAYESAGKRKNHADVAWVRRHMADRTMFANCVADFWDDSAVV